MATATSVVSLGNRKTFTVFPKTVTTPGTAEQFPNQPIPDGFPLTIKGMTGNAANIYLGPTKALAEAHYWSLAAKDAKDLFIRNANEIWIDADNPGEGVECICEV